MMGDDVLGKSPNDVVLKPRNLTILSDSSDRHADDCAAYPVNDKLMVGKIMECNKLNTTTATKITRLRNVPYTGDVTKIMSCC